MIREQRIALVVHCDNESNAVSRVLGTVPAGVDRVNVIDDASRDSTGAAMQDYRQRDQRGRRIVHLIDH